MQLVDQIKLESSRSNWDSVLEAFERLSGIEVADNSIVFYKIQALIKTRKFSSAKRMLLGLNREDPKNVFTLRYLYDLEYARCAYADAEFWADEIISNLQQEVDGYRRKALACFQQRKYTEVKKIIEVARSVGVERHAFEDISDKVDNALKDFEATCRRESEFNKIKRIRDDFDFPTPVGDSCSVVVPLFNAARFVESTISSLLKCGHDDLEIIFVDDCSTDGSADIVEKYIRHDSRIKLIRLRKNSGPSTARNVGLVYATKEFITFLDADDLIIHGSINRRIDAIRQGRRRSRFVVGGYGGSLTISQDVTEPPKSAPCGGMKIVDYISTGGDCPFNANQPLFITSFLRNSGGFPESSRTAEDWPFWLRLLRRGGIVVPTHSFDVTYRTVSGSTVRSTARNHLQKSKSILESTFDTGADLHGKAFSEYLVQQKLYDRFFSFTAMHLASLIEGSASHGTIANTNIKGFIEDLKSVLPDVGLLGGNFDRIYRAMCQGLKRYYCVDDVAQLESSQETLGLIRGFAQAAFNFGVARKADGLRDAWKDRQRSYDIAIFPHKEYHVRSAALIAEKLRERGLKTLIVDFSCYFGEEGVTETLTEYDSVDSLTFNEFMLSPVNARSAAAFNDWDPVVKEFLAMFKRRGLPTFGIVEGVNDYWSIDTGVWRPAYQFVDHLILPGEFDKKYFKGHDSLHVGGVQRLDPLLQEIESVTATNDRPISCVINCNFTYGVLTEHRLDWLGYICRSLIDLGCRPIISRHPQDVGSLGIYEEYVDNRSMYELLKESRIFISRFSGAIYEALLSGCHVIYFNPGIENIDMFIDPMGAYSYVSDPDALKSEVERLQGLDFDFNDCISFLKAHCSLDSEGRSSSEQTALVIEKILSSETTKTAIRMEQFEGQSAKYFLQRAHEFNLSGALDRAIKTLDYALQNVAQKGSASEVVLANQVRWLSLKAKRGQANSEFGTRRVSHLDRDVKADLNNLFVVFSCQKYRDRIALQNKYYRGSIRPEDDYIFVVGGATHDYIDGRTLYLACPDTYESLPEKVHRAIVFCHKNFKFRRLMKIDDDIFVNFDNLYRVVDDKFNYQYYGRKNPPLVETKLNKRWHFGKVSKGHFYDDVEFPIHEPAQWNSGGFYILDHSAVSVLASHPIDDYVITHVYEDYMVYEILIGAGILPSFHEDSLDSNMTWMHPTLSGVLNGRLDDLDPDFRLASAVSIHCGPAANYTISNSKLSEIFGLLSMARY